MPLLPLHQLGARETAAKVIDFGVLLPGISGDGDHRVAVKVIHERDQFLQDIPPHEFQLTHAVDPLYGDRWELQVDTAAIAPLSDRSSWGKEGTYVYRYLVEGPGGRQVDFVCDPYAREFGVGKLSAVTVGYQPHVWSAAESQWRVPALEDLVIYELMLAEFAADVDGAIGRLDYLADLGVTCLEVMPVSNVSGTVDWGFLPIGYFGVDDRFGKRSDFQRFVDEAHQRGIAVILDAVYGHTSDQFAYSHLYRELGHATNPFHGSFGADYFGESTDFKQQLVRDFFLSVNEHWLSTYHVDGFRYDCVPCYWDGVYEGYANLVYETYRLVDAKRGVGGSWDRFFDGPGAHRLVQCAEQLERPVEVLQSTYSNATWQNGTLGSARAVANGNPSGLTGIGFSLGLDGFPREGVHGADRLPKAGLQYVESHDHERLICSFGMVTRAEGLLPEGDRSRWYKLQPYLIGMLTGAGIPMLWQGQELGENYFVPDNPPGARVGLLRPMHWEYFYDQAGQSLLSLVRRLIRLRRQPQFRRGSYYFHNDWSRYQSQDVVVFSRQEGDAFSVVALNFGDADRVVSFDFPVAGDYTEGLHGFAWPGITAGATGWFDVPSNYGRVWTTGSTPEPD